MQLTRTYYFWFTLTALSIAAIFVAYHFFPRAFPIIHVDITIDRSTALQKARELADKFQWGPAGYQQAVSFDEDVEVKHFIELEGGGKEKLTEIIEEEYYFPYYWHIRHFKEYEPLETAIYLTPEGVPYGFEQQIPETAPGAALDADQARAIAESVATSSWSIDFAQYTLVESSQEKKPSNRIDHTFVYERKDKPVGEGRYRLKLIVSGDTLTAFDLFFKVPEGFTRRYEHMRSANNTIAYAAFIAMAILYLLIGCLFGLAFLHRTNALLWKPAIIWAALLSFLQSLNAINYLPLRWMYYDTAIATMSFHASFLISIFITFLSFAIIFSIIFVTAEGLTRTAFGAQPQLWRVWSPQAASSIQILGRTLFGYLWVPMDMVYIIFVYLLASRYLGWWSPSETLFSPNVLGSYLPWLSAISSSLNAGFMEECLFRAIPLAGATLLGRKYGKEKLFLALALIIQAIIFGAAHANYPAQPAYARLVELIIPSFIFAFMYLRAGLLTSIICHFVYDVIWFALPLFIATAPRIWIDKLFVIVLSLLPVWIVLHARWRVGRWHQLAQQFYNSGWIAKTPARKTIKQLKYQSINRSPRQMLLISTLGIIGLLCWLFTTRFDQDNMPVQSKKDVINRIEQINEVKNIPNIVNFTQLITIDEQITDQHRFAWKTIGIGTGANKTLWQNLLSSYLQPTTWKTRYAQFAGDVAERAEEIHLRLDGTGRVREFDHVLPEARAGQSLTEAEVRQTVHTFIKEWYKEEPTSLIEVSAVSEKRPNRLDWTFTFRDPAIANLGQGQARMDIGVAGDQVVSHNRYIFVPEEWVRKDRHERTITYIIKMINLCIALLAGLALSIFVFRHWYLFPFSWQLFAFFAGTVAIFNFFNTFNFFDKILFAFSTAQPYIYQLGSTIVQVVVINCIMAALVGYLAAIGTAAKSGRTTNYSWLDLLLLSLCGAAIISGAESIINYVLPQSMPFFADYQYVAAHMPLLATISGAIVQYINSTTTMLLLMITFTYLQQLFRAPDVVICAAAIFVGFLSSSMQAEKTGYTLAQIGICGLLIGLIIFIFYRWIARDNRALIPLAGYWMLSLKYIQQIAFHAVPNSTIHYSLALILPGLLALAWTQIIIRFQTMRRTNLPIE
jgi:membrane protease YdiL (CAAX protease family)